ncbi:MAG: HAD hydrolase family protein, partial [Terriglobia bacterium]
HAAQSLGVEVVIVTGRRFHSARPFVEQVDGNLIVISSNGARIGSLAGKIYYRNFLSSAVARQVVEAASEYKGYAVVIFDVPGQGQVIMHNDAVPEGPAGWYMRNSRRYLVQTSDLAAAITSDPVQMMFGGPLERVAPVESVLRVSAVNSLCHLTWTKYLGRDVSLLDVMNRGCSKGSALAYWARQFGIQPEEVMAIGDNQNDAEMLRFAGQAVLTANHNYDVIQPGWAVTLSNDEDGVAAAIERYVLS